LHIFVGPLALLAASCSEPAKSREANSEFGRGDLLADGDEIAIDPTTRRLLEQSHGARNSSSSSAGATADRWSIVLATASGPNHQAQAEGICRNVQSEFPELRSAFVRSTERGSAVWFGRYTSPDSPNAISTRQRIQSLARNGKPVFSGAFMSVLPDESPIGDFDLRKTRLMHPGIDPLYTLQIACWGTFQSTEISWDTVQRESERYTAELRRRGHQAWYYHDPVTQLSVVTLGVFDRRAYDPQTTLFSPEVELLRRQFPLHLINGEEVLIELTPGNPDTRVPQECRLVTVPSIQ
jgi:hypothetical protein